MSWQDMGLYWAWRGNGDGYQQPSTTKKILYKPNIYGQAEAYAVIETCNTTGKKTKRTLNG